MNELMNLVGDLELSNIGMLATNWNFLLKEVQLWLNMINIDKDLKYLYGLSEDVKKSDNSRD